MRSSELNSSLSGAEPIVSVVLAVNRDDGFLDDAIDSILDQTFDRIELLIIANNCTDELWEGLKVHSGRDPRIRLIRSPLGQLPYNLNLGLHHARGEFVARMDADDVALPDRVERQVRFLIDNESISVLGGNYEHIDENGNPIGKPSKLCLSPAQIAARLPFETCLPHPTVMFRRSAAIKVGGYAYGLYAEDWDLWLRMRRAGMKFANLPEIVLRYRIHSAQSTSFQAMRRNMANVQGLLLRELVLTGSPVFILAMARHFGVELVRRVVSAARKVFGEARYSQANF